MSNVICQRHLRIDALRNLETLTYVSIENWTYDLSRLRRMTRLRNLGMEEVDGSSNISKLFASLSKMRRLDNLTLKGFRFKSMPSLDELGILRHLHTLKLDGRLARLPSANNFPQKICYLKFVNSCLDEDPMSVLEKLPKLKYLKLRNAYTGQQMVILHDGFPELKVVCIEESWNLRDIQIGEGAMLRLEKLEITNCPYLETLPEEIGSMASLKELKMVTTKKVATKIGKLGLISKVGVVDINP